jgi:GT2 family glycosyltransferase
LIVADNGSGDGTAGIVAELAPGLAWSRSVPYSGFAAASNAGAGAGQAGGELLLLNPDARPLPAFAPRSPTHFRVPM